MALQLVRSFIGIESVVTCSGAEFRASRVICLLIEKGLLVSEGSLRSAVCRLEGGIVIGSHAVRNAIHGHALALICAIHLYICDLWDIVEGNCAA